MPRSFLNGAVIASSLVIPANVSGGGVDTDSTFAANSDTKLASQKAIKTALALKAPLASPTFNGTMGMTPGTLVGGGTSMTGGQLDPINHLHLANTYTQTATPLDPTVGTPLWIESNVTLNYANPQPAFSEFGPLGLANISGLQQYNVDAEDLFGIPSIGFVDMLKVTNEPGTPLNLTPGWSIISARKYIADGAVVTAQQVDAAEGPAAFYDSNVFISKNTGEWDGLTNDVVIGSYISNPFVLGNAHFKGRRAFEARDVNEYQISLAGPLGADGPVEGDVEVNVGFFANYMDAGTVANVGLWNASGTVEPGELVTLTAGSVLTVNSTNIDIDIAGDVTLTANPWIAPGVDYQRVRLNSTESVNKLTIPQNHGAIFVDPDDAGNITIMPGTSVDLVYRDFLGAWAEPTYRHARHLYTGKLAHGGSIRTHSEAVGPSIEFRTVDTDTYATASLGVLGGDGTYAAGSGTATPDTFLKRASAGLWSTLNSSLTLGTGDLTADAATFTGVVTMASPVVNTGISGSAIDTDSTFAANSDTKLASQKAIKTALALKAPLASPTFTGTVTLPAQTVTRAMEVNQAANSFRGNNTGSAATALDLTVAQAKTLLNYVAADIPTLAPLASPTFTGTVTLPTVTLTGVLTSTGSTLSVGDGTASDGKAVLSGQNIGVPAAALQAYNNTADTQPAAAIQTVNGTPSWRLGPGGSTATDVFVARTGAGTATVTGTLTIPAPILTGHPVIEGVTPTGATGTGKFVFDGTPTLVTPVIGAATGTSLAVTGAITSSGPTGIGYATGAGGTSTQPTNKTTAFPTISKTCGTLTWAAAALAADTSVTSASSTNAAIAATDVVVFTHISGGTLGAYGMTCTPGAGTWTLTLHNLTPASLNEAPVFRFAIIKGVTS